MNDENKSQPRNHETNSEDNESRTALLFQKIQSEEISAKTISITDRRMLVAVLINDGHSTPEIAQILKLSDRSIERDRQAIRQGHALPQDPKLVSQMAGQLFAEVQLATQRIRKAVRDKSVPATVKVDAEHRCYQILSDSIQRFQSLGYLPTATQRIEAQLTHNTNDLPDLNDLRDEFKRLQSVLQIDPVTNCNLLEQLAEVGGSIERAGLAAKIEVISSQVGTDAGASASDERSDND